MIETIEVQTETIEGLCYRHRLEISEQAFKDLHDLKHALFVAERLLECVRTGRHPEDVPYVAEAARRVETVAERALSRLRRETQAITESFLDGAR